MRGRTDNTQKETPVSRFPLSRSTLQEAAAHSTKIFIFSPEKNAQIRLFLDKKGV